MQFLNWSILCKYSTSTVRTTVLFQYVVCFVWLLYSNGLIKICCSYHPTLSIYNGNLIIPLLCHKADGTVFPLRGMFTFRSQAHGFLLCCLPWYHQVLWLGQIKAWKSMLNCRSGFVCFTEFSDVRTVQFSTCDNKPSELTITKMSSFQNK